MCIYLSPNSKSEVTMAREVSEPIFFEEVLRHMVFKIFTYVNYTGVTGVCVCVRFRAVKRRRLVVRACCSGTVSVRECCSVWPNCYNWISAHCGAFHWLRKNLLGETCAPSFCMHQFLNLFTCQLNHCKNFLFCIFPLSLTFPWVL